MAAYQKIIAHLESLANSEIAEHSQRFFKTGKGEYGYGDKFLGIRVPTLRKTAKLYSELSVVETKKLLKSEYHEVRLFSLLILVDQYSRASEDKKEIIYNLYLKHTKYINNWDLVDSSAHYIVGAWLAEKNRSILYELVNSKRLWERRIAMISTFYFIKKGEFNDTLKLSKTLINDPEDLIHKAVGWMLREIGNRDQKIEEKYLEQHYKQMPRTMLRYSIEKFSKKRRQEYLKGEV
ncbi:MAG: DNA alkylation repair protein [Gammaproteobacteria bacterium]|nr:DNA alkylation repair protein [Gammaproteobacteria bacterium]